MSKLYTFSPITSKKQFDEAMATHITFFAHGTTTDNQKHLSSGWNDVELSELGRQQSRDLAALTENKHFDVVFTSDLKRAIESAKLTWADKYKTVQDSRLRECHYGDYDGQPSAIVEPLQEKAITTPLPNGESYEQVKHRMAEFLADLKTNYEGKRVAIVGHKATQLALDVLLKGQTWEQAFVNDWRKAQKWQPGWDYVLT